ncbi:imelysin family protein [Oceanicola sp. S124]|uniref:imelysin family protein n=1 Tax=Oceanicola sp. S124 TaxID=1042378 RepID=UPI0002557AB2|nr:imelysin family protein [Oceanicola sp. S124]
MRLPAFVFALTLPAMLATPAHADLDRAIANHVLPGTAAFASAAGSLAMEAQGDCRAGPALRGAYDTAFDAWLGISHLRFGPLEVDGRVNAIAFWPDKKGFTPRILSGLIADEDPIVDAPEEFHELSVAARGFFALDMLLFDEQFAGYDSDSYSCRLVQAISTDLARMGNEIDAEWRDEAAPLLLSAGEAGNTTYLSRDEAVRVLYTALLTGLEFDADQRLGLPLGTFERPRPERAEARRSGRSLRNVEVSLRALEQLARTLMAPDGMPVTEAAFADALSHVAGLDDPVFAGVEDPSGRLKVEILLQRIQLVRRAVEGEIGAHFGLTAGFNSADGD